MKAASNPAKHGVSFSYATRVFLDETLMDIEASDQKTRRSDVRRSA